MIKPFSIITVTRNHLSGLKATQSSLAQENTALFEWIVIDGASTDGTADYLATTNAQWLSEPDNGIYDAMNKGLARARGDYVLFLNAGDTLALPRTLETLAEILKARPVKPDLIYGDAFETTLPCHPGASRDLVDIKTDQIPAYAGMTDIVVKTARPHGQLRQGLFTHHQSIFYARETINDLHYDQRYDIAADYKFTAEFLRRAHDVFYWPRPVCLFEAGGVSQRRAFRGRMQQSLIRRELQMTLPIEEVLIVLKQTAAYTLRRVAPKLYWRLRATSV